MEFFHFFDIMSLFNEKIKEISIRDALIIIILSYLAALVLKFLNLSILGIFNVVIILYFVLRLKAFKQEFKLEVSEMFAKISFKDILLLVLFNICFSYGMLYLVNFVIDLISLNTLRFFIPINSIMGVLGFLSIVLVSPIAEELIFRGIFLNKLKLIIPTVFAILISSLLFASLHSLGSIFSAFICFLKSFTKVVHFFLPNKFFAIYFYAPYFIRNDGKSLIFEIIEFEFFISFSDHSRHLDHACG